MSQRRIKTVLNNRPVQVTMGWDRPLGYFHLVIELEDPSEDEEDYLYSNLEDPTGGFVKDLRYYESKLNQLGIRIPQQMFVDTSQDQCNNVGNLVALYREDGSLISAT